MKHEIGDIVRITGQSYNHNYAIGKEYEICTIVRDTLQLIGEDGVVGDNIHKNDVEIIMNIKYFEDKKMKIYKEIEVFENKINFLIDNKFKSFDDNTFKTYKIVETLDSKLSKKEKIEFIKNIIS